MGIQVDTKSSKLESARVYAQFDRGFNTLTKKDYEIISLLQNAELRIQQGKDAYISRKGNYVLERGIYRPREKNKISRMPLTLRIAREMTRIERESSYRDIKEYFLCEHELEQALSDSINLPEKNIQIPTNRFDSEELPIWAFGGEKKAKTYGEFLEEAGIKKMPILIPDKDYIKEQYKPFAKQIFFQGFDSDGILNTGSSLNAGGGYPYLADNYMLRGVKISTKDTVPQDSINSKTYSSKQIVKALNELGFPELGKTLLEKLR